VNKALAGWLTEARDALLLAIAAAGRDDYYEVADQLEAATEEIRKALHELQTELDGTGAAR